MKWTVKQIAEAVNGKILNANVNTIITGAHFDSRKIQTGQLFIPLIAERDGHDFAESARDQGASVILWSRPSAELPEDMPAILVNHTEQAMNQLARAYLDAVDPVKVAVTGSNGKTTTKDMIAAISAQKYLTHATSGNFNNEIGVPKTIFDMPDTTEVIVIEMGMDRPGQIEHLSKLVAPDIAVITMVGESHIEFFGTREKIAEAKIEIISGLKSEGTFIYDGDEPLLTERTPSFLKTKTFGQSETNNLYPTDLIPDIYGTKFQVNQFPDIEFTLPIPGKYNVNNALAALLVAEVLEINMAACVQGFLSMRLSENRLEWLSGIGDTKILNDAYNASPTSMKAALDYFQNIKTKGRKIAALGDIRELGEHSKKMHQALSQVIDLEKLDYLYLFGDEMGHLYDYLLTNDLKNSPKVDHEANDLELLTQKIKNNLQANDHVLVKSSFGTNLLALVKELTGKGALRS